MSASNTSAATATPMTPPADSPPARVHGADQSRDGLALSRLEAAVQAACSRVSPVWPLERFVAVNPYMGFADHDFRDTAGILEGIVGARSTLPAAFYLDAIDAGRILGEDLDYALATQGHSPHLDVAAIVNEARPGDENDSAARVPVVSRVATCVTGDDWQRLMVDRVCSWAAAYFDGGQALWRSTDPDLSLFAAWKQDAAVDRTPEIMGLTGFRAFVRSLPEDPSAAAAAAVAGLEVPVDALEQYFHALLLQVGGWSAHAARIVFESQLEDRHDDTLVQWLAVLVCWELGLLHILGARGVAGAWQQQINSLEDVVSRPQISVGLARRLVLQEAFDRAEYRRISRQLDRDLSALPPTPTDRASAQAVFCIDVRSETIRRNLETVCDSIETIGFAGFFGFPIEYLPIAHDRGEAQCPVLLRPAYTVRETLADTARYERAVSRRQLKHHVRRAWKTFKMGAISCFSFVGPVGLIYLPKLFTDGYGHSRPVRHPAEEGLPGWALATKRPDLGPCSSEAAGAGVGIPHAARVDLAEAALRTMSLTDGFAPLVVIVGHGASTVNNPYDAGLGCGACGGHSGEANARIAASIFNDPEVRASLAGRGITIPDDTWFLAAQHNTTTDEIVAFDQALIPERHTKAFIELRAQLDAAGNRGRVERSARLGINPGSNIDKAVRLRANDWAQVRPEWGLAGCRAFIVAPRARTKGLDLQGRSFLHSYHWRNDPGFRILEVIMTAPLVVATWISLQYYASTVDNDLFGAGNKTLHNVVGRLGVLEGNAGDLRVGLPWQSVHDGTRFQHEPLRLNVIIEAPTEAMSDILSAHPNIRDLCDNRWIHLLAMGDTGEVSHRYVGGLCWEEVGAP